MPLVRGLNRRWRGNAPTCGDQGSRREDSRLSAGDTLRLAAPDWSTFDARAASSDPVNGPIRPGPPALGDRYGRRKLCSLVWGRRASYMECSFTCD